MGQGWGFWVSLCTQHNIIVCSRMKTHFAMLDMLNCKTLGGKILHNYAG